MAADRETAPRSLAEAARLVVGAADPAEKVHLAREAARAWRARRLSRGVRAGMPSLPDRPGRPARPELLAPRDMPKRSTSGARGRFAMIHALAHIELNAVDLTWDLIARFFDAPMPHSFLDDWVRVGAEEARHFALLDRRLADLGGAYGDLPAHDGLWQTAQDTGHSLLARVAIVPMVLEARGLDVTPSMIDRMHEAGDTETAGILEIIYRDEKTHVAFGVKWFRFLCAREGLPPEPEFQRLVQRHFKGRIKPPFNDRARAEAGLVPGFYKPLVGVMSPT